MTIYSVGHGTRELDESSRPLASGGVIANRRRAQLSRFAAQPAVRPRRARRSAARRRGRLSLDAVARRPASRAGGRRPTRPGASTAFRAYADYMDTPEFARGLDELARAGPRGAPTAYLCAETHWSQCHRRLISDKLWSLGHEVIHLITPARYGAAPSAAVPRVDGDHLRYDLV